MKLKVDYPQALYIELTDKCNLMCPMCRTKKIKGNILPINLFKEIAKKLFPYAKFVDLRGWGESTILKNFLEYVEISSHFSLRKKLISNGTVNDQKLWQMLAEYNFTVGFSVDASYPDLFKKLRGGADLDVVKENINSFVSTIKKRNLPVHEYAYFCITVSGDNIYDLPNIIKMGLKYGIRHFKLEPIFLEKNHSQLLIYHRQKVKKVLEILRKLARSKNVVIELSASLLPELVKKSAVRKICIHPFKYLYINAQGRIGFCDHLNGKVQYTFGHWNDGFDEVWYGPAFTLLRLEHIKRYYFGKQIQICKDCNWCYNYRYMDLEDWVDNSWKKYRVTL